ncbi:hypothetical protein ACLB2K_014032 [Fragaria x ananassa]
MVRSLLSAGFSSRPSSAVKPPETVTIVPKASPSSLLHCWIGGASSGAAVRDKSSSKTPPVWICSQNSLLIEFNRWVLRWVTMSNPLCKMIVLLKHMILASKVGREKLTLRDGRDDSLQGRCEDGCRDGNPGTRRTKLLKSHDFVIQRWNSCLGISHRPYSSSDWE